MEVVFGAARSKRAAPPAMHQGTVALEGLAGESGAMDQRL
jgi:hypothetical protein